MYVRKKLLFCCYSTAFNSVVLMKFPFFKQCEVLLPVIIAATAVLVMQQHLHIC